MKCFTHDVNRYLIATLEVVWSCAVPKRRKCAKTMVERFRENPALILPVLLLVTGVLTAILAIAVTHN